MTRQAFVTLGLFFLLGGLSGPIMRAQGLTVSSEFDPITANLQFKAENHLGKRVTAFELEFVMHFDDGRSARFTRTYEYVSGSDDGYGLGLGDTFSDSFEVPDQKGVQPVNCTVQLSAVIFEDRSYEGRARTIDALFRAREAGQLVRERWLRELRRVASEYADPASIRTAVQVMLEQIESGGDVIGGNHRVNGDHTGARTAQRMVAWSLKNLLERDGSDIDLRFRLFVDFLSEEFDLVDSHVLYDLQGKRRN